ncbi:MAG TPA: hypothetical protein VEH52_07015 [Gaiellaceae bacterium]|jgi:hypothetical protein|nr:hypothetical protein [Gaiellaceae bacterium]
MRRPLIWLLGGFALLGFLRRRHAAPEEAPAEEGPDPRAEELRDKLAESRAAEPDTADGAEADAEQTEQESVEHVDDPATRRRAVHETGREIASRMRETST